jgi:tetratricopeptide (TPR) repeat protein
MRIGPYEVVTTVGQGGAGTVYRARSPEGREVAIKVLRRTDAEVLARFERERRLLGSLGEAEGFVSLVEAGTAAQGPYLVMPFVPGGTLRERLAHGRLGVEETRELGRALAAALGAAHERGIVHRDMKPENVLFAASGQPLVADLGLAKHFDTRTPGASQSVSLSRDGTFRGTAGYMAPEQMNDAKSAGPAADVFALGAILYECLTGAPPFVGENVLEIVALVAAERFDPIRKGRPEVPGWLARTIERALAAAPEDRFPDALAFGHALAAGAPASRRLASILLGVGLAAAAGLAGLGYASRTVRHAPPPKPAPRAAPSKRPPASAAARARAEEILAEARRKIEAHDLEGGIADATRAIELDPTFAQALVARGLARSQLGDREGAIEDAGKAIEADPTISEAWSDRGRLRGMRGDYPGQEADCARAIELDPENLVAWINRGMARESLKDHEGAIADATRAIELDPGSALGWNTRALARASLGQWDADIADATQAIELAPGRAIPWNTRAFARWKKGDLDGAIGDMTKAIELDPGSAVFLFWRGTYRERKGDTKGATSDLEEFLRRAPDDGMAASARSKLELLHAR